MNGKMNQTVSEHTSGRFDDELFKFMECIVIELDPRGCIVRANPFAANFWGMETDEMAGKSFIGGLAPKHTSNGRNQVEVFENIIRHPEKSGCVEMEVWTSNGKSKNIVWTASARFDSNGMTERIICLGIDRQAYIERENDLHRGDDLPGGFGEGAKADNQKKAQLALAEKEFRFCFEHAQVLLVVTDEEGVIRSINRAGARLYGRQPEDMIGRMFTEFLPDFERERVFQTFKRDFQAAMAETGSRKVTMGGIVNKITTPDGLKDILFYKAGVKVFNNGKFEGILNTAVDITEIVRAREELKKHRHQLEQLVAERTAELQGLQEEMVRRERLTALGKMANVISQEIRTPLSTISNSIFVINECLKEKEMGVKRSLERANRAIRRCYGIVDEFKIFTQTDDFKKKGTEIDIWLNGILDQLSKEKGISFARDLVSGVTLEIDRDRLQRAVVNVIENALQAAQPREEGRIAVNSRHAFNRLEIEIEDEGIGIKRKNLEEVFEPLFSTKSFGLGIGLPISRQIMEQHGGGISIESEERKGTRVLLWLPADRINQSAAL